MTAQTVIVNEVDVKGYKLSVTTRDAGDDPKHLEEITYRTIFVWLMIAEKLEKGDYTLAGGTVEDEYVKFMNKHEDSDSPPPPLFELPDAWGDARCTVWDTFRGQQIHFHLNSDDVPQTAINTWVANTNAIKRIETKYPIASQSTQAHPPASATNTDKPATPKSQNAPQNAPNGNVAPLLTKKQAIETLPAGSPFRQKIVQIKKRSTDGKDFYEFYEPYGGKPGDFSAVSVFTDNEVALNNGLIAYLDTLGIKVGQAITGEWIANSSVGKPKTKMYKGVETTFTNTYINSFEGQ